MVFDCPTVSLTPTVKQPKFQIDQLTIKMSKVLICILIVSLACAYTITQFQSENLPTSTLTYRQIIIGDNLKRIRQHNEDKTNTFKLGTNPQFLPYTVEENVARYLRKPQLHQDMTNARVQSPKVDRRQFQNVKGTISRDLSPYTPTIYNQNICGNCYAYATVASINALLLVNGIYGVDLSVQEMTDCSSQKILTHYNLNCSGGDLQFSLWYATYYGLHDKSVYPTNPNTALGQTQSCKAVSASATTYKIRGWVYLAPDYSCISRAAAVLGYYTVPTAMFAGHFAFFHYLSGIFFTCPAVGSYVDHAVLIVGFQYDGTFAGSYMKVKNSWGNSWGVGGFFYIAMTGNVCNICLYSAYPVL